MTLPTPTNLVTLDFEHMAALVARLGWPAYRTRQILQWIYQHRIQDIAGMSSLSLKDRETLGHEAVIERLESPTHFQSVDGTQKFLHSLKDGLAVESVLIPDGERLTQCVSTQVGCTLDCGFCVTGQMGLKRNLKAHEIVEQILTAQDRLQPGDRITSLVFMGMGEPLANFDELSDALTRLTNTDWGVGFPKRRITISTAGFSQRLHDVAELGVNLAVSLNASTAKQRDRLMPMMNRLHSLPDLLAACRAYPIPANRYLTFEYVLLQGENDSTDDAVRLSRLLRGIRCKINLIPFNEFPNSPFRRPADTAIAAFQTILRQKGYDVFVRQNRGRDVWGACGQLGNLPARTAPAPLSIGT
jgi:23S rRNA (adenine2503-C2)-methyltransferase